MGLRPGRRSVRLEYEEAQIEGEGACGAPLRVVHNYGKSTCVSHARSVLVPNGAPTRASARPLLGLSLLVQL